MTVYENEINETRIHEYRKKIESICYSKISTKLDMAKTASKLMKHFRKSNSIHLQVANHCLHYLYSIRYLGIEYSTSKRNAINVQIDPINQIFEAIADVFYANNLDRKNGEGYSFKLFDELIDLAVRKQLIVTIFTIEAELFSMFHANKKLF